MLFLNSCHYLFAVVNLLAHLNSFQSKKTSYKLEFTTWPNGVVYYKIDSEQYTKNETDIIREAMNMIESQTRLHNETDCIKFTERTNQDTWINIGNYIGCWSYLGMFKRKGPQTLSLQKPECISKEIVAHNLMHALGFNHEHQRPDRDEWIEILYDNIRSNSLTNFDKSENDRDLNTSYDYTSIMHYKDNAFAKDLTKPTMRGLKGEIKPGKQLSTIDVEEVRKLYNCKTYNELRSDIEKLQSEIERLNKKVKSFVKKPKNKRKKSKSSKKTALSTSSTTTDKPAVV